MIRRSLEQIYNDIDQEEKMKICKYRKCNKKVTGSKRKVFCSPECKNKEYAQKYKEERKVKIVFCNNPECKKKIEITNKSNRKYCDNKCRKTAMELRKITKEKECNLPREYLERGNILYEGYGSLA